MKSLMIDNQTIELTDDGFLSDRSLWSAAIATALADKVGIALTEKHWQVIDFLRQFYQQFQVIPPLRIFIKNLKLAVGEEIGNSLTLHQLFPDSPLKLACLIAGLPKPKHCM